MNCSGFKQLQSLVSSVSDKAENEYLKKKMLVFMFGKRYSTSIALNQQEILTAVYLGSVCNE